jgi:hypothetical protein
MGAGNVTGRARLAAMLEEQVREAIMLELRRQAETWPQRLQVDVADERLTVSGEIDLEELAMAIVGAVAGGP